MSRVFRNILRMSVFVGDAGSKAFLILFTIAADRCP